MAEAYVRQDIVLDRKDEFANNPMAKALSLLEIKFDGYSQRPSVMPGFIKMMG